MARVTYLLDTNIIAETFDRESAANQQIRRALMNGDAIALCQPVHYEVLRGLLHVDAKRKLVQYQQKLVPLMQWVPLIDDDWDRAAQFWAGARRAGHQFSDVDLLLAALASRLNGVLISADEDFDALPINRENWP